MHPSKNLTRVVNGKRYSVSTATLLASDEYWDGNNFEHGGRNEFLYRTPKGAYFAVYMSQWEGEDYEHIASVSRDEAMRMWDDLREHEVTYEEAFDSEVEEASLGRPTYYDKPMTQTAVWLPDEMIAWLKEQPGGMGEKIRELIKQAMD